MEKLPENMGFYKGYHAGWSKVPPRSSSDLNVNTFFDAPLFASKRAIQTYGEGVLIACVVFLRDQARQLDGIDSFQRIADRTGERPTLIVIEEGDSGDRGIGVMFDYDEPLQTIAILDDEYHIYCLRTGWEWLEMRALQG